MLDNYILFLTHLTAIVDKLTELFT